MINALFSLIDVKSILICALVMIPFEQILPLHEDQKVFRKGWLTDTIYLIFNGIPIKIGFLLILASMMVLSDSYMPTGLRAWVQDLPFVVQALAVIVIADLGFYATHRLFHTVPALWKFHAVHHSIEEMDWLAAHRVHPVDQIATMSASLIPVYALGFETAAIVTYAVIYHWHALILHSNTRLSLGWFNKIIASPHFHHWHHAKERHAWDKNFAGQLTILDRIFGTLHMPDGKPKAYGCSEQVPASYPAQLAFPFLKEVAAEKDAAPSFANHAEADEQRDESQPATA